VAPEVRLDTATQDVTASVAAVLDVLRSRGVIPG